MEPSRGCKWGSRVNLDKVVGPFDSYLNFEGHEPNRTRYTRLSWRWSVGVRGGELPTLGGCMVLQVHPPALLDVPNGADEMHAFGNSLPFAGNPTLKFLG